MKLPVFFRSPRALAALTAAAFLCVGQTALARQSSAKTTPSSGKTATLINQLGDDALIYLRLSNPFDGWRTPGKSFAPALDSKAHDVVLTQLRARLSELISPLDSTQARGVNAIVDGLNGPVELALAAPGGVLTPAASVMLRIPLNLPEKRLLAAINAAIAPKLAAIEFDAEGHAKIIFSPEQTIALHFDRRSGELSLNMQMGAGNKIASKYLQAAPPSTTQTAQRIRALDPTERSFALWVNVKSMAPYLSIAAQSSTEPAQAELIAALAEIESISLSSRSSTSGGGEIVFAMNGFSDRLQAYLPKATNRLDVPIIGTPRSVLSVQLPSASQARAMLEQLLSSEPNALQDYQQWVRDTRFDPLAILDAIGPSVHLVTDQNGSFCAVQLQSKAEFERYLSGLGRLLSSHEMSLIQRQVKARGENYTWLSMTLPKPEKSTVEPKDPVERALARITKELVNSSASFGVFRIDGNWLLLNDIPQTLYGRKGGSDKLAQWLRQNQKQDLNGSLFAYSAPVFEQSTQAYQFYLSALNQIGLLVDRPIAIEDMPAPAELNLPTQGAMGISVDRLERGLEFKLHYKDTSLELLGGYSMVSAVFVTSVLAAIALPAYQDYTVRAKVSGDLALLSSAKIQLTETLQTEGHLPKDFAPQIDNQPAHIARVELVDHSIVLTYSEQAERGLAGTHVALTPCFSADPHASPVEIVGWACGYQRCEQGNPGSEENTTSIPAKYLPKQCR